MSKPNQRPVDVSCEGNALAFSLTNMIGQYSFIDVVRVVEVTGDTLTVISMISGLTTDNARINNEPIYGVPFLRLQRGVSAVIMDPVAGDIGFVAICDRDITNVKTTKADSVPGSKRTHSPSDAIYLTGIASLNATPLQYVHFRNDGIDIVSPMAVTVSSPIVQVNADNEVSLNAPSIVLNGAITQGSGSYAGTAAFKNAVTSEADFSVGTVSLKTHKHTGVQSGSSETGTPVA